jgi:hypothetical protein
MVAGRTVAEARALTKDDLLAELGMRLSAMRLKCALLSLKVFKAALYGPGATGVVANVPRPEGPTGRQEGPFDSAAGLPWGHTLGVSGGMIPPRSPPTRMGGVR